MFRFAEGSKTRITTLTLKQGIALRVHLMLLIRLNFLHILISMHKTPQKSQTEGRLTHKTLLRNPSQLIAAGSRIKLRTTRGSARTLSLNMMAFLPAPALPFHHRPPSTTRNHSPRMTASRVQPLNPSTPLDKAGFATSPITTAQSAESRFRTFFSAMPGSWNSERTYHYLSGVSEREESQTTFDVSVLTAEQVSAVLASNETSLPSDALVATLGFRVEFLTRMASQEELVKAGTNLAFVPGKVYEGGIITGDYYRDLGYEESAPVKAKFVFDCGKMELGMTTFYSKVVSVDQISLISDSLRLRKIVNYRRVEDGEIMDDALLVGFGVERKGEDSRLVQ